ncbi:MAG TPA: hypothetical protein VGJ81_05545 [Thermoanaerobaculia bacterium]|jgi:hypothetical protein
MFQRRATLLILLWLVAACSSRPAAKPYDTACFAETLPVGVGYQSPRDVEERLLPRHDLSELGTNAPYRIVTLRSIGPYSEPEVQLTIFEMPDGTLRGEFLAPVHCSINDQLHTLFVHNPASSEDERIKHVRMRRTMMTDRDLPELRTIDRDFRRLRISADLEADLVLDARIYDLWVETPENTLHLRSVEPERQFQRWADGTVALLSAKFGE